MATDLETPERSEVLKDEEPKTTKHIFRRDSQRVFPGDEGFDEHKSPVEFVINAWAQDTSIHGVPFITDASVWNLWKRLVWVVLVLTSASCMLWQITTLCIQYRDFDVITDTQTINPRALEFPEITICTGNSFSKSRQIEFNITDPTNEEELALISTPLTDLIISTSFNLEDLDVEEVWKEKFVASLGRCWSFTTDKMVRRPGFFGGLDLLLNLNQDDFAEDALYASAFVWATLPNSLVNIYQTPAVIGPGQEAFLVMDLTEFERERTAPWTRCASNEGNPTYTQNQCRIECTDAFIRKQCGCREYGDEIDKTLRFCTRSEEDQDCLNKSFDNETAIIENCDNDCSLPGCFEQNYRLSNIAIKPSKQVITNLARDFNTTEEYLEDNLIQVTINYRAIEYTLLTESKGLTLNQLLGSIGGSMGFFLGVSMVSVFEFVGDLICMRLIPRLFGYRHMLGLGSRIKED